MAGLFASRRWVLAEARLYLLAARMAIRLLPFRRLTPFFDRRAAGPELAGAARAQLIKDVRWAIWTATRHQRERIVCFPRAVAAQAMLRRRGVSTTLYYGAATLANKGLTAHVWLQDGDTDVVGKRSAVGMKVLARYPAP
ncbi:MAG: lasso peptide biosynthesis B2 protein [Anaerolineales bacterium]